VQVKRPKKLRHKISSKLFIKKAFSFLTSLSLDGILLFQFQIVVSNWIQTNLFSF